MTYICWAALYEGATDQAYFDVLIPNVINELILQYGTRNVTIPLEPAIRIPRDTVNAVSSSACAQSDAFHLFFIHSDTGGRGLQSTLGNRSTSYCGAMAEKCNWPPTRCVTITPKHEMEAWALCDPNAVLGALGYSGSADELGLPRSGSAAERLNDPKGILDAAFRTARSRRSPTSAASLLPTIAQRQSIICLRECESFRQFEARLYSALADIGCVEGRD